MARDYVRERLNESPARREARNERHRARRLMLKKLTAKYGAAVAARMMEGKDVDHKKPAAQGGKTTLSNLRLRDEHENRADKGTIFKGKRTTRPKDPRAQKQKHY